ncbi:MAG: hypothetical protein AAGJ52_07690, partial [Pseudomonadota bacterium]
PRTAQRLGRQLPGMLARSPELPTLIYEYLKLASQGSIRTRIDSGDLEDLSRQLSQHNRRLPGAILAAGLIVAGAVLAGYQVGPMWQELSIPGGVSALIGLIVGWRALGKD